MSPESPDETSIADNVTARNAGILLVVATVLAVASMAHHPSVTSRETVQAIEQIASMSDLSA